MDHAAFDRCKGAFQVLLKQSHLDIVVPLTDLNLEVSESKQGDHLLRLAPRTAVFLDERLTVYIVLRTTHKDVLQMLLPHLELSISAHASNLTTDGAHSTAAKHDIATSKLIAEEDVNIEETGGNTYVIWKEALHLVRPRVRLQNPGVYFTATLGLTTSFLEDAANAEKHYLPSFQALPSNVLRSLKLNTEQDEQLYMSEARITRLAPPTTPQVKELPRTIRASSKTAVPLVTAIIPRLRQSSLLEKTFLWLQIDVSSQGLVEVSLDEVTLDVSVALVEQMSPLHELPRLRSGEEFDFVYSVVPKRAMNEATVGEAVVTIRAVVKTEHGTNAELNLKWRSHIDLRGQSTTCYEQWLDEPNKLTSKSAVKSVVFDFAAPATTSAGLTFDLAIKCMNKSSRTRRFIVRSDTQQLMNTTLALYPQAQLGPIHPGECFESTLTFEPLKSGVQELGVITVFDCDSGKSIVVHNLPTITAQA